MKWAPRLIGCGVAAVVLGVLALLMAGGAVVAAMVPGVGLGSSGGSGSLAGLPAPPPPLGQMVVVPSQLLPGVPAGGYPDAFPFGECTYWAALNHRVTWNGNAVDWFANAKAKSVPTSTMPAPGDVVVYAAGNGYSPVGHVAIVIAVASGSYSISEMNYAGFGVVDERTIGWPDSHVEGFIP